MRLITLLLLLLAVGCGKKEAEKKAPSPLVTVAEAQQRTMPYVIRAIGTAWANNTVNIVPQVSGMLVGAFFESGDFVEEGDLLFAIDPRIYAAELGQAQGQLERAAANLQFGVQQLERYSELLPEDFVSKLDIEKYLSQAEQFAGDVNQFESAVDEGKVNLEFCTIRAPMRGKLGRRITDPGNIVDPEMEGAMVVLNQITPILVYISVPERFLPLLRKYQHPTGLPVYVKVPGEGERRYEGRLQFIDNQIEQATGILTVRGVFANEELDLWPGQFCESEIVLYEIPDAIVIPNRAVNYDPQGPFVYVVDKEDRAQQKRVEVGQQFGEEQVITSGITEGERVITEGQMAVTAKVKVEVSNKQVAMRVEPATLLVAN